MYRRQLLGLVGGLAAGGLPSVSARQSGYAPLGQVEIGNATEAVVDEAGETAFVATETGFAVVDISDPTAPTLVAEREDLMADHADGPMEGIIDLAADAERLVVPGPGNPTDDVVTTGFVLFDVAEPSEPRRLAFHETATPIHNAFIEGDRVYLTQGTSVEIVDVADGDPKPVGTIRFGRLVPAWSDVNLQLRAAHDVWVQDRIAYVPLWEAGTIVVDVAEPGSPTLLTHIEGRPLSEVAAVPYDERGRAATEPPGNHHYARASADGRLLAIGKESWATPTGERSGGASGIELWDISAPSAPVRLSEIHPPRAEDETRRGTWTTSHNFDLVGDRLYSSWYQGGVKIHDVSDPGDPRELAWWRQPDRTAFWTAVRATEDVFVASSTGGPVGPTITEGLFTFPTAPGAQADPPATPRPATSPSRFATARPTPTPTPTPSPSPTPSPDTTPPTTASGGQPGFGLLAGIAGMTAGLGWLHGRRERDDP